MRVKSATAFRPFEDTALQMLLPRLGRFPM
jgi:hypothetical protein